jgi:transposase
MARTPRVSVNPERLLNAALAGLLDEAQARQLAALDPALVTLALLALARRIAQQDRRIAALQTRSGRGFAVENAVGVSPSTPSGMIPPYAKPNAGPHKRRRKKRGAKNGHKGHRRPTPTRIDQKKSHRLPACPCCGGRLQRCHRQRTRIIEDIPRDIQPVVTAHTIHRDFCPRCKKHVEPKVPDALPGATLGHRVTALTSWFHYGLGVTLSQVVDILGYHLQTQLTPGGLIQSWQRLSSVLQPWYEQIGRQARSSAVLHADETGWRVDGQTHWLWCFANGNVCYYMVDRCRGSPALQKFFAEAFAGTLVHDFWAAYEMFDADDRQYCLVHLLRELESVDLRRAGAAQNSGAAAPCATDLEWQAFAKKLRRLIHDGIRLRKRADFSPQRYARRILLIDRRLNELATWETRAGERLIQDADALRLSKRLRKHWNHLFTFLDKPEVPFDNNLAERMIRPAVIIRKNSQGNRSQNGAATQATLMSLYRTLKLRGHNPIDAINQALRTYVQTGHLPPLPEKIVAGG